MRVTLLDTIQVDSVIVWSVVQTMFVFLYGTQPWWRHYVGRAMFFKSLALALLLDAEVSAFLWPYKYSYEVKTGVILVGAAASVWQLLAFVRQISNAKAREVGKHV